MLKFLTSFVFFVALAIADSSVAGSRVPGCGPENVTIEKVNFRRSGDYTYATGVIKHNCKVAVGVELKWTGYYSDGSVAFSRSFWPNSISNIPRNTDFPFEDMNLTKIPLKSSVLGVSAVGAW